MIHFQFCIYSKDFIWYKNNCFSMVWWGGTFTCIHQSCSVSQWGSYVCLNTNWKGGALPVMRSCLAPSHFPWMEENLSISYGYILAFRSHLYDFLGRDQVFLCVCIACSRRETLILSVCHSTNNKQYLLLEWYWSCCTWEGVTEPFCLYRGSIHSASCHYMQQCSFQLVQKEHYVLPA